MTESNVENTNSENAVEVIQTDVDFGFDSNSGSKYAQVYFVKPMVKKGHFELNWKENDKKYVATLKTLQGKLLKIEESEYVYDEKLVKTLKLHLEWKNKASEPVLFIMGTSYTNVIRTLLNSLLGCNEPINDIKMTFYEKNGFASLWTTINGEKSEWKYDWKNLNEKVIEISNPKTGAVIQRDYSDLNEYLTEQLFAHIDVIIPGQIKEVLVTAEEVFGESRETIEKKLDKAHKNKPTKPKTSTKPPPAPKPKNTKKQDEVDTIASDKFFEINDDE